MTPPTPPNKPANWARISKTLAFWALVILVPVLFLQYSAARTDGAQKIDYTAFDAQLTDGNGKSVGSTDGKDITGELKQQELIGGKQVKKFTVMLPGQLSDSEKAALKAHNVNITAEKARPSIGAMLISWLPAFLIIAIWIFIFRHTQAGRPQAPFPGHAKAGA